MAVDGFIGAGTFGPKKIKLKEKYKEFRMAKRPGRAKQKPKKKKVKKLF